MGSINQKIAASGDDIFHRPSDHVFSITLDQSQFGGNNLECSLRFTGLSELKSVPIESCVIRFIPDFTRTVETSTTVINIEAADTPAQIIDDTDWHARTLETTTVVWTIPPWTADIAEDSTDISSLLQLVVDRSGFVDTVQFFFIVGGGGISNGVRIAESFDQDPNDAPELRVVFTDPEPIPRDPEMMLRIKPLGAAQPNIRGRIRGKPNTKPQLKSKIDIEPA